VIENAIERFSPPQISGLPTMLQEMLEHVMHAEIKIGEDSLKLAEVSVSKCIHEFEFDFTVSPFRAAALRTLADENIQIEVRDFQQLEGVMNGKIDLFFEKDGKYYVLDWKSNFLGDSLDYYNDEAVAEAMNENNYHLQHLLYTLAVKKYLESRLPDFDYETQFGGVIYLFIRGVRKSLNKGVFAYKAGVEKIEALDNLLSENEMKGVNVMD
jgi:exodeoxyribonuclease V beta subunit